jgi:hypothetical protein
MAKHLVGGPIAPALLLDSHQLSGGAVRLQDAISIVEDQDRVAPVQTRSGSVGAERDELQDPAQEDRASQGADRGDVRDRSDRHEPGRQRREDRRSKGDEDGDDVTPSAPGGPRIVAHEQDERGCQTGDREGCVDPRPDTRDRGRPRRPCRRPGKETLPCRREREDEGDEWHHPEGCDRQRAQGPLRPDHPRGAEQRTRRDRREPQAGDPVQPDSGLRARQQPAPAVPQGPQGDPDLQRHEGPGNRGGFSPGPSRSCSGGGGPPRQRQWDQAAEHERVQPRTSEDVGHPCRPTPTSPFRSRSECPAPFTVLSASEARFPRAKRAGRPAMSREGSAELEALRALRAASGSARSGTRGEPGGVR